MLSFLIIFISVFSKQCDAAPVFPGILRRAGAEPFVLPIPTDGPGTSYLSISRTKIDRVSNKTGPTFDDTATRVAISAQIRSVASHNTCFDVSDFRAGDFRFNLVPIALKPCDASVDGQKFDLITKGEHNDIEDGSRTLIVSSQQLTCIDRRSDINDRTRPGLFACGGRAAGDGGTTADQQYFFNSTVNISRGIGFPLVRDAVNNGVGPGNQCLTLNSDGFLSNTPCAPPLFTPEQTWTIGANGSITLPADPSVTASIASISTSIVPNSSITPSSHQCQATFNPTQLPPSPTIATTIPLTPFNTSKTSVPTSSSTPEKFVLPVPTDGPGPTFDATATRAATSIQIRSAASPDICLDVSDFRAGDFRFNLVPIALRNCDPSIDGQRFDLITKGVHNDVPDGSRTLIVSSQQFTCIDRLRNKNDHRRPGLFACGGRAAGDGGTQSDEQFFFNVTARLSDGIGFPYVTNAANGGFGSGNQCLSFDTDGFASNTPCSPPLFTPEQTWIVN